jgi:hypothetical protein
MVQKLRCCITTGVLRRTITIIRGNRISTMGNANNNNNNTNNVRGVRASLN